MLTDRKHPKGIREFVCDQCGETFTRFATVDYMLRPKHYHSPACRAEANVPASVREERAREWYDRQREIRRHAESHTGKDALASKAWILEDGA